MGMPMQWRRGPKPDPSVVALTGAVDKAAQDGHVQVVGIVTVNPMLDVEFVCAGELNEVRKNLLISGLTRLVQKLSE